MPITLRIAIGLVGAQLVALLGLFGLFLYVVVADPSPLGIYVGVFAALFTAGLSLALVSLIRLKAAGRGGVFALELLVLAPVYYMITGGQAVLGVVIGASAIAVMLLLIAPATSDALR